MRYPLCVMLPELGVLSETFLDWDVNQLLPGGTVAVADPPPRGETVQAGASWSTTAPVLRFDPIPGDPSPSPTRRAAVENFLNAHGTEVVVVEFLDFAERWFDILLGLDVRVWVRGHGADLSARPQCSYTRFNLATGVTVPTTVAATRLFRWGVDPARIHVVPNHVEVPACPPEPAMTSAGEVRCVSIGRLVPKKGHYVLLDAFRRAAKQDPRLRLGIIGDGPLRSELQQQVEQAGLTDRVRLLGALPPIDVARRLSSYDVLVHHALPGPDGDVEGQPLAILQAMSAALPVVASRHEGIPEVVVDGHNGLLVDEGDVDGTAAAILRLAADRSRRRNLGRTGWATVRHQYTHDRVRGMLLELLGLT